MPDPSPVTPSPLNHHPHASPTDNKHHDVVLPAPVPARRKCRPRQFHAKCQCASRSWPALPSRPILDGVSAAKSRSDPPIGLIVGGQGSAATLPAGFRTNPHAQTNARRRLGRRSEDETETGAWIMRVSRLRLIRGHGCLRAPWPANSFTFRRDPAAGTLFRQCRLLARIPVPTPVSLPQIGRI